MKLPAVKNQARWEFMSREITFSFVSAPVGDEQPFSK